MSRQFSSSLLARNVYRFCQREADTLKLRLALYRPAARAAAALGVSENYLRKQLVSMKGIYLGLDLWV